MDTLEKDKVMEPRQCACGKRFRAWQPGDRAECYQCKPGTTYFKQGYYYFLGERIDHDYFQDRIREALAQATKP